jgi:hypothetical protein
LDITFDRHRTGCEAFSLMFSIIPVKAYRDVYMSCNNIEDESDTMHIPSNIQISKTNIYQYASHIKKGFNINNNNNLEKVIVIDIEYPIAFEVVLKYIHSDNLMDISLYYENGKVIFKASDDNIEGGHVNGIWVHKNIKANIKKGRYVLKLLYHSIFSSNLMKVLKQANHNNSKDNNVLDNLCFGFNLEIISTSFSLNDNLGRTSRAIFSLATL